MGAISRIIFWQRLGFGAVTLAVLFCLGTLAEAQAGDFESANELFEQGKFAEAKQHYEKLAETGTGRANVFYNLGNTDYRLGSMGRAMLSYERALVLDPRHPEARANLRLLQEKSAAKRPVRSWSEKILASQSLAIWTWGAVATGWLLVFGIVFLATSSRSEKGGLWFLTLIGAAGLAVSAAGVWIGVKDFSAGVVTAQQTEARLAPAESAGVAETLTAGSRVRVLSERGAWIYCELPGTGRGWIPQGAVERIRPKQS